MPQAKVLEFEVTLKNDAQRQVKSLVRGFDNIEDAAEDASKAVRRFSKNNADNGKKIKKTGLSAKSAAKSIAGLAGAFVTLNAAEDALTFVTNFEQSLSNVSTLIKGDATQAINQLEEGIKDLLQATPATAEELGAASYDIVSAGITDTAEALQVLEASTKLGVAGLGTTSASADLVTSAINAFGLEASSAESVANTFFNTVAAGKTTVDELATGFGQVAPFAAAAGVSFNELQAATAALTTSGLQTSVAQTQLKAAFTEVTREGTKLDKAFESIGVSNVKAAIESDGFVATLERLQTETGLSEVELKNLFGSVEAGGAAIALLGEQSESFNTTLATLQSGVNGLDEAYQKNKETTQALWQQLKNNFGVVVLEIASVVLPALNDALKLVIPIVQGLVEKFRNLSPDMQKVVVTAGSVVVALTALGIAAGSLSTILGLGGLTTVIKAVGAALLFIAGNPIVATVSALAALAFAIVGPDEALRFLEETFDNVSLAMQEFLGVSKLVKEGQEQLTPEIEAANEAQVGLSKIKAQATDIEAEFAAQLEKVLVANRKLNESVGDTAAYEEAQKALAESREGLADFIETNKEALSETELSYENYKDSTLKELLLVDEGLARSIRAAREAQSETEGALEGAGKAYQDASANVVDSNEQVSESTSQAFETAQVQLEDFANTADSETGSAAASIEANLQVPVQEASTWGLHMVQNFASGVTSGVPALNNAIDGVVATTKRLQFSTNKEMPTEIWGLHAGENFASGFEESLPQLNSVLDQTVNDVNAWGDEMQEEFRRATLFDVSNLNLDLNFEVPRDLDNIRDIFNISDLDIPEGDEFRKLTDEQKESYKQLEEESKERLTSLRDQLKETVSGYEDLKEAAVDSLVDIEKETKDKIQSLDSELLKLNDDLNNLQDTFSNDLTASSQSVGEAVVRQEEKISGLKDQYAGLSEQIKKTEADLSASAREGESTTSQQEALKSQREELAKLTAELEKESGALQSFFDGVSPQLEAQADKVKDLQAQLAGGREDDTGLQRQLKIETEVLKALEQSAIDTEQEIQAARERARLTDFERFIADAEAKKLRLVRDFAERKVLLQEEINEVNKQRDAEIAAFEDKIIEYNKAAFAFDNFKNTFIVGLDDMSQSAESRLNAIASSLDNLKSSYEFLNQEANQGFVPQLSRIQGTEFGASPVSPTSFASSPFQSGTNAAETTNNNTNNITIEVNNPNINGFSDTQDFAKTLAEQAELNLKGSQ